MTSRRKFFSLLPLAALGAVAPELKAEPVKAEEPSPWVEITCQRPSGAVWRIGSSGFPEYEPYDSPACEQRFKVMRVPVAAICPKCGWTQDLSRPCLRELFTGIPC